MDMRNRFSYIFLATFYLLKFVASEACQAVYCDRNQPAGQCGYKNTTETVGDNVYVTKCTNTSTTCPAWSAYDPSTGNVHNCTAQAPIRVKYYGAHDCESAEDCMSANCNNNTKKCVVSAIGEACTGDSSCDFGGYCGNAETRVCVAQNNTTPCTNDYSCLGTHGCLNGVCTEYYTVADGVASPSDELCSSGWRYAVDPAQPSVQVCASSKIDANTTVPLCTEDCKYKLNGQNTTTTIVGSCECAKNSKRERYCQPDTAFDKYQNYLTLQKKFKSAAVSKNCHTSERTRCNYWNKNNADDVTNSRINRDLWDYAPALVSIEDCVKEVYFPDLITPAPAPTPAGPVCPRITCDHKQESCAIHSLISDGNFTNSLNGCLAKPKQQCPFYPTNLIDTRNSTTNCTDIPVVEHKTRYPGEACTSNYTCLDGAACGKDNKCPSKANSTSGPCSADLDCPASTYCNGTICQSQLSSGAKCTRTFECGNGYACHSGVCTAYFNLDVNVTVDDASLCKYNRVATLSNGTVVCDSLSYHNMNTTKDNMVECKLGSKCTYKSSATGAVHEQDCTCGYNKDGKAYCPAADDKDNSAYYTGLRDVYTNKCHTLRRTSCDLDADDSDSGLKKSKTTSTRKRLDSVERNLYYGAEGCARWIFGGSANYIFFSSAVAFIVSLFMF